MFQQNHLKNCFYGMTCTLMTLNDFQNQTFLRKIQTLSNYFAIQVQHLIKHGFYDLHTGVHDWRVTVMRWLFMPFFYNFLVLTIKIM